MIVPKDIEAMLAATKVLVIDDEPYMRKVIRSLLMFVGVRKIFEATDGAAGLEAITGGVPDIVILDWEMPLLNGPEFVRIVRSPETFSHPDVPIIMLTGHVERSRVVEAILLGVNEYICKPVAAKTLLDRIVSIRTKPRPSVRLGNYYGPVPRKVLNEAIRKVGADSELAWV
jgi:two-component system, chemotaxis family, chemotaxis protein CheY